LAGRCGAGRREYGAAVDGRRGRRDEEREKKKKKKNSGGGEGWQIAYFMDSPVIVYEKGWMGGRTPVGAPTQRGETSYVDVFRFEPRL